MLWSRSNCVFHLLKVVTVTFLFLELVVGALSAVPFWLDMANSWWLGVTSIFATRHVRKWVWPEDACNARCVYAYAYRPAGHNVRAVLHWAAISVLGTEYGRWPTVIMHTEVVPMHNDIGDKCV